MIFSGRVLVSMLVLIRNTLRIQELVTEILPLWDRAGVKISCDRLYYYYYYYYSYSYYAFCD